MKNQTSSCLPLSSSSPSPPPSPSSHSSYLLFFIQLCHNFPSILHQHVREGDDPPISSSLHFSTFVFVVGTLSQNALSSSSLFPPSSFSPFAPFPFPSLFAALDLHSPSPIFCFEGDGMVERRRKERRSVRLCLSILNGSWKNDIPGCSLTSPPPFSSFFLLLLPHFLSSSGMLYSR